MRLPRVDVHYYYKSKRGSETLKSLKGINGFIKELRKEVSNDFIKATLDGDRGRREVTSLEDLKEELYKYFA